MSYFECRSRVCIPYPFLTHKVDVPILRQRNDHPISGEKISRSLLLEAEMKSERLFFQLFVIFIVTLISLSGCSKDESPSSAVQPKKSRKGH